MAEAQSSIPVAGMIQAWRSRFQLTLWRKTVSCRDLRQVLIHRVRSWHFGFARMKVNLGMTRKCPLPPNQSEETNLGPAARCYRFDPQVP